MTAKKTKMIWGIPGTGNWLTEDVSVTPEIAALMLSKNQDNRPVSGTTVSSLSDKMSNNNWVYTHQGLAFSTEGKLLDGQHRLLAVIDSGTTQTFPVTYNLDPSTFDHIDVDGRKRTSSDLLAIRCPGIKNRATVCGTASMMLRGIHGYNSRYRSEEIARFAEERRNLIVPFVQEMMKGQNVVRRGPVIAAFCAAARGKDSWPGPKGYREIDAVMMTAMRLVEQEWAGAKDPLKAYYNRLVKDALAPRKTFDGLAVYGLTVSAIRADISNRKVSSVGVSEVDWGDKNDHGGPSAVKRRPKVSRPKTKK